MCVVEVEVEVIGYVFLFVVFLGSDCRFVLN